MFVEQVVNLAEMRDVVTNFAHSINKNAIILLHGEMGAGKTTFAQFLIHSFGITEHVTSPTYTIVNEYQTSTHKIFHFDLHRLKSENELEGIGFTEYIDSNQLCIIEWPEIAMNYLDGLPYYNVQIDKLENSRKIAITTPHQ